MAGKPLRTRDLARDLGVHENSIRKYEDGGLLPPIPRGANGYRQYSAAHLEQARLIRLALQWPYLGDRALLLDLVRSAALGDLGRAMELAFRYLALVRVERAYAEAAVEFLERWAGGQLLDTARRPVHIGEAAQRLSVTVDMLRHWERNGLIDVPRDPANRYRVYGAAELGRVRVIRTLAQAGYSLMAILRMLQRFDAGDTANLRGALDLAPDDEALATIADRWLSTLGELEQRAQAMIRQIGLLIELRVEQ
jgi:DNA-binding transcriptional MerR regulator